MIELDKVSRELVRTLRGKRSQPALSRWLKYNSNVVYLWESGRRWPTASSFFWLAHRTGVDVIAALDGFLPERDDADEPWSISGAAAVMRALQGQRSASELARELGHSRHAVSRWLRGETEPRLPELLRMVDLCTTGLLDFIALFVDPAAMASTRLGWRRLGAARALVREQPWAPAVLLALQLDDYRALDAHEEGWLTRRLGLPEEAEGRCLALLSEAGQIRRRQGRWRVESVQSVDVRTPERKLDLKRWWAQVGLDRIGEADGIVSWNLFTISEADFERIQQLQRQHYRAVRAIVAASEGSDRLVLTNLQLLALDAPDEPDGA